MQQHHLLLVPELGQLVAPVLGLQVALAALAPVVVVGPPVGRALEGPLGRVAAGAAVGLGVAVVGMVPQGLAAVALAELRNRNRPLALPSGALVPVGGDPVVGMDLGVGMGLVGVLLLVAVGPVGLVLGVLVVGLVLVGRAVSLTSHRHRQPLPFPPPCPLLCPDLRPLPALLQLRPELAQPVEPPASASQEQEQLSPSCVLSWHVS